MPVDTLFDSGFDSGTRGPGLLTRFGDLFSQFARYIAPSYHHDRPERSIQMRLYTMQKGQHLLLFIMFLCLFFIALLMGMAGPKLLSEHTEFATKMKEDQRNINISSGPFVLMTPELNTYRQMLWISTEIKLKGNEKAQYTQICKTHLTVEGLSGRKERVTIGRPDNSRTRTIHCNGTHCDAIIVLHLGIVEYSRYVINMSFDGLDSVDKHFGIEDIYFHVTTYNPEFTEMEIWFRFFFVLTTIGVSATYAITMKSFPLDDWALEQKWVAILLSLLLNFNNPMFPLTLSWKSLIGGVLDVFFQTTFLFSLMLFWLVVFHGLRQTERGIFSFYLPKIILVGMMWFSAVIVAILEDVNELSDPSFSYELNITHYSRFQMLFVVLLAAYCVYLLYLSLRAFGELRSMRFLDSRLKFHAATLTLVLALTMSILGARYGSGVLEDNFIARIYTSYESEWQFLAFYTVINCYVYALAYAYAPTSAQKREKNHLLKDNPAFSMINESDDDDDDGETEAMLMSSPNREAKEAARNSAPLMLGHDQEESD